MKLEKLLEQQAALAKQIDAVRKAEAQAKKEAAVAYAQARKAAVIRAVEKAGLFEFDPTLLSIEFQKIAKILSASATVHVSEPAPKSIASTASIFESGE